NGAFGRCALYNCIDVGIGICTINMPTPYPGATLLPGVVSVYEHDSQSANFMNVALAVGGMPAQWPVVVSGLHHGDAVGYGSYSVIWARDHYASLTVIGGNLDRGFQMNVATRNANLVGPCFAASLGPVGGTN